MENQQNEIFEIPIEKIDQSTWWMIGNRGITLGGGSMLGTWVPNKEYLHKLLSLQFQLEADCFNTQVTYSKYKADKNIMTDINYMQLLKGMIIETAKNYAETKQEKKSKRKKIKKSLNKKYKS